MKRATILVAILAVAATVAFLIPTAHAKTYVGSSGCYSEAWRPVKISEGASTATVQSVADAACPSPHSMSLWACLQRRNSSGAWVAWACQEIDDNSTTYVKLTLRYTVPFGLWRTHVGVSIPGYAISASADQWPGENSNTLTVGP